MGDAYNTFAMKPYTNRASSPVIKRLAALAAAIIAAASLAACSTSQIRATADARPYSMTAQSLYWDGVGFITPSSVTGQEEDKQALSQSFTKVLQQVRPELLVVSLPMTLTAVNRAGLAGDYRRMIEDYRTTGMFDQRILRKVGEATGVRYLVHLKLAGFRQESKNRWGAFGLRVFDTMSTTIRLFVQIWDGTDGSIAWEGSVELTSAHESMAEEMVTFGSAIEEAARRLVERLPR